MDADTFTLTESIMLKLSPLIFQMAILSLPPLINLFASPFQDFAKIVSFFELNTLNHTLILSFCFELLILYLTIKSPLLYLISVISKPILDLN